MNINKFKNSDTMKIYKRYNYYLVLDKTEVNLENPGDGTPAMIYMTDHDGNVTCSNTYWCVMGEGEMENGKILADSVYSYFDGLCNELESFLYNDAF